MAPNADNVSLISDDIRTTDINADLLLNSCRETCIAINIKN